MNTAITSSPTQQAVIVVIRVGFGVRYTRQPHNNPLNAHLEALEKQFGMPFYLHPFEWMTPEDPILRPEHRGKYCFIGLPDKQFTKLTKAILAWIDKKGNYPYAHGISYLIAC